MGNLPSPWNVFCLLALATGYRAGFGADAPALPLAAERVHQLAAALCSEEYEAREQAMEALSKLGAPAWPLLAPFLQSEDPELGARLRRLAKGFGILLPEQRERVRQFLAKLEDPQDKAARAEGLDGMLTLGPAGIELLRKHLSGEGAKPELRLEADSLTVPIGQKFSFTAQLINAGSAPFWRGLASRSSLRSTSATLVEPFGERRPSNAQSGGGRTVMRIGGRGVPHSLDIKRCKLSLIHPSPRGWPASERSERWVSEANKWPRRERCMGKSA